MWIGNHPASGGGSSPHSWGIAMGDLGLLDSLVSQRTHGSLIVGRGVPDSWVADGRPIAVSNFPAADGRRIGGHDRRGGRRSRHPPAPTP